MKMRNAQGRDGLDVALHRPCINRDGSDPEDGGDNELAFRVA